MNIFSKKIVVIVLSSLIYMGTTLSVKIQPADRNLSFREHQYNIQRRKLHLKSIRNKPAVKKTSASKNNGKVIRYEYISTPAMFDKDNPLVIEGKRNRKEVIPFSPSQSM